VRCAPKSHPCPDCGKPGHRKRHLHRRIRSLAYRQEAWLDVHYAEYQARCRCCKYFRSWPLDVPAKADYDGQVRQAVLDRILGDGLNVQRTRAAMKRDFLLELSEGFVYDCLRWQISQVDMPAHRRMVIERFSGTLSIDELPLGRFTLLLATDPLADLPVAFALVRRNDLKHRFLIVKKSGELSEQQWQDLVKRIESLPPLRALWRFAADVRGLFEKETRVQTLLRGGQRCCATRSTRGCRSWRRRWRYWRPGSSRRPWRSCTVRRPRR
jgi:hypothetical protein